MLSPGLRQTSEASCPSLAGPAKDSRVLQTCAASATELGAKNELVSDWKKAQPTRKLATRNHILSRIGHFRTWTCHAKRACNQAEEADATHRLHTFTAETAAYRGFESVSLMGNSVDRTSGCPKTSDSGQRNLLKPALENQSLAVSRVAGFLGKGTRTATLSITFGKTGNVNVPGFLVSWLRELDSNKHCQIQNLESYRLNDLAVALAPGIEPRLADSKSAVLPLDEARVVGPRSPSRTGLYGFSGHRNDRACSPGNYFSSSTFQ